MQNIINQFKKIAPYIVSNVKARVTVEMTDAEIIAVIHEEIQAYFAKQQDMAAQHMAFNDDQRATFASAMYDLLAPLAEAFKDAVNPKYKEYVAASGKTGALNYITKA